MKKLVFTAAVALSLAACSQQSDFDVEIPDASSKTMSVNRSADEAILIANQVLSAGDIASRGESYQKRATKVHAVLGDQSRSGCADTLLYAVDVENDGGFILVAAPRTIDPIMAIIDEGSYNAPENLKNEPYQETLEQIKANINRKAPITINPIERDTSKLPLIPSFYYDTIDIKRIHEPAVKIAWGQEWPENLYASNKKAGCIPVAIAQLLSYLQTTTRMNYTYTEHDVDSETIKWLILKRHKRSMSSQEFYGEHCVDCSMPGSYHQTIGRMLRQLGNDVYADYTYYDMPYGKEPVTLASPAYVEPTIRKYISKSPKVSGSTLAKLYNAIDTYGGAAVLGSFPPDSYIGHAWIADGSQYVDYQLIRYEFTPSLNPSDPKYTPVVEKSIKKKFIHYNWGDGGICNGWFNINATETDNAEEYDYDDISNNMDAEYQTGNSLLFWLYTK